MSPIKDFHVLYKLPNKEKVFSDGDTVSGTVTFTLTEDVKVKSLYVKIKGHANVKWTESTGVRETTYYARKKYLKLKEFFVGENVGDTVLPRGDHRYNFSLKIPQKDMPSSFKGSYGSIVYSLEAKMSRSWHLPNRIQEELTFVPKSLLQDGPVMCPQSRSAGKEVGVFSKGEVKMSATADRKICCPGGMVSVIAKICNSSSKKITPKFSLHRKRVYRAGGSTKTRDKVLCTMAANALTENSEKTVSCKMEIPADAITSVHNCEIISVNYYLKVYLDIFLGFDPEVKLPLVIIPSGFTPLVKPGEAKHAKAKHVDAKHAKCKQAEAKQAEAKKAEAKQAEAKQADAKQADAKQADAKQADAKQAEAKQAAAKQAEAKQAEASSAAVLVEPEEEPPSYASLYPPTDNTFNGAESDEAN